MNNDSYLVEEERELIVSRISVFFKHPPSHLGPFVRHHLPNIAIRSNISRHRVVAQEFCTKKCNSCKSVNIVIRVIKVLHTWSEVDEGAGFTTSRTSDSVWSIIIHRVSLVHPNLCCLEELSL